MKRVPSNMRTQELDGSSTGRPTVRLLENPSNKALNQTVIKKLKAISNTIAQHNSARKLIIQEHGSESALRKNAESLRKAMRSAKKTNYKTEPRKIQLIEPGSPGKGVMRVPSLASIQVESNQQSPVHRKPVYS